MTDVRNVFADEWEQLYPPSEGWHSNTRRLVPPGNTLGMSLYELLPGQTQCPYHFHHANDELVLVLHGRPTLRTPEGERELEPGDFVHFPKGAAGAHQMVNRTDEPARYVDSGKLAAFSRLESQRGDQRLVSIHRLDDGVDYFDGESPKAS